ncbi:hypothetical protein ScPMuIL_012660 [Solemya velum]
MITLVIKSSKLVHPYLKTNVAFPPRENLEYENLEEGVNNSIPYIWKSVYRLQNRMVKMPHRHGNGHGLALRCLLLLVVVSSTVCLNRDMMQRFDGWYNSLTNAEWGSTGETLRNNIPTNYKDNTYQPSGSERPSARLLSNIVFRKNISGPTVSFQNRTALFAFFGEFVIYEITDTDTSTCPVEILKIPIPQCDDSFDRECEGNKNMPYSRIQYSTSTGQSPNAPRQQVNAATSFLDGKINNISLPYENYPSASTNTLTARNLLWKLGNTHVYENPALLSLGLLFFKWHNVQAEKLETSPESKDWSSDRVFYAARRWVIATQQNIIMYEWLPLLLNTEIPKYTGYKSSIHPGVTSIFDAAAIRYLMTLIPSLIQKRLCNTYWRSQEILSESIHTLENIFQGLTSQPAEAEDPFIVEDLQSKFYGPLHFARHDLAALTIMKGRDYGLPDYNTVRSCLGLKKKMTWEEINPELYRKYFWIFEELSRVYKSIDDLDVFVGGMLETTELGPGELFSKIILDQFITIRNGDRFWFENLEHGIFTEEEIQEIRNTTLYDIIVEATNINIEDIQRNTFTLTNRCPVNVLLPDEVANCTQHQGYNYFHGSEVAYIIIWVCFGLLPFLCVLAAYICAKYKQWQHRRRTKEYERQNNVAKISDLEAAGNVYKANEWLGQDEKPREVMLRLTKYCHLEVFDAKKKLLRTVKLAAIHPLEVWVTNNKGRTALLIKIPKEYDMALIFPSETQRSMFEESLNKELKNHHLEKQTVPVRMQIFCSRAFTKKKRNTMLEKVFKTVFSEAFQMDYDPDLDTDIEDRNKSEILEINLTKEEFAEALSMKSSSDFVETMFCKIDKDNDGYISFREFLQAVVLFSKGTSTNKLERLFQVFDLEDKGSLQRDELTRLFRSLLEKADSDVDENTVKKLVDSMCNQAGMAGSPDLEFKDFCQIMSPILGNHESVYLNFNGETTSNDLDDEFWKVLRESSTECSPSLSISRKSSIGNFLNDLDINTMMTDGRERVEAEREKYTPLKAKWKSFKHYLENNRQHIFFLIIFYGIVIALFAERFYFYTVEREHSGLRALMSYGISVTRGAAAGMSFTFSLLLLTMCRNIITGLRETTLNLYLPFDSHVAFHKIVAWTALFFTGLHVLGYAFNFYHIATLPTNMLCILDSVVLRSDFVPTFDFWLFGNMTGLTGVLLVVVLCIMYVFSTQTARRYIFNMFWLTHKLIVPMYILTILHGASVIVQKPMFFVYFTGPAILFTIDKMISLSRKKTQISIIRAENLQSDVTYLEFKRPARFEYKSGQWVRIACLAQGKNEYHPFTLTSAPHEDTLKLHIRALGPWTWTLRHIFEPENLRNQPYPKLYLDGPYGAGQQDWYQYDVSVLVGAGIGVTPYASILKDFVHMSSINCHYKVKCQKLYFIWVTGTHRHFEWLLDILREVEEVDVKRVVSIDIFITQFFQNFDLRTAMLYICEEHFQKMSEGRSVFTGLKAATHFGRPQLNKMLQAVQRAHYNVRKVGVFSCGPPGITKSVERACVEASKNTRTLFDHHFENF